MVRKRKRKVRSLNKSEKDGGGLRPSEMEKAGNDKNEGRCGTDFSGSESSENRKRGKKKSRECGRKMEERGILGGR